MKKFCFIVFFSCMFGFFSNAQAANIEAALYANNSTIDGRLAYLNKIDYGYMVAGFEGTYKSDYFNLFSVDLGVKSDDFIPGVRYKLGFKAVYLDAEKNSDFSSELASLCFLLGIDSDLPEKINPLGIPISLGGEFSFSPKPLTWNDGEYFLDGRVNLNFHIMGNAAIIAEYRYLKASFDDRGHDWNKENHNFLFGYRIRF
ncbi:MAG: hypothetical protein RBR53_10145 [Desulforegulaceae bacterium]|nr:hypothetical protein [Desulforegulaceae bacterium]